MEFVELDKDLQIVHLPFCPTRKLLVCGCSWIEVGFNLQSKPQMDASGNR